jgi:hypothetical protein
MKTILVPIDFKMLKTLKMQNINQKNSEIHLLICLKSKSNE